MKSFNFPDFVKSLPEAGLPFEGLRGWLLQSKDGLILFNESEIELTIPEHSHGNQWGVVLDGKITLTIGDETKTYYQGDTYHIPAGVLHKATIYPGFRAIDHFEEPDRYRVRTHGE